MAINLNRDDFDRLVGLLAALPEMQLPERRVDFMNDVFAGSPLKNRILSQLDLSGMPRGVAVRVVDRLARFGQDEPGQETLGLLINRTLVYLGGGEDAEFLRSLFRRYPLQTEVAAARGVEEWRGRETAEQVKEKVIGENTLRDVLMLEQALRAARAVVRIVGGGEAGTGFLCGLGLIMTCNHVLPTPQAAAGARFEFNYQLGPDYVPRKATTVAAKGEGLFFTDPDLDFTVVEIAEAPAEAAPLPLLRQRTWRDARVNIIQHPGGHYKKISMQNNFVAYADARDLQYLTTTEPGSSGSPVMNDAFEVLGIHHSGGTLLEPGSNRRYLRNAGSSMIAVLDALQQGAPAIYQRLSVA